MHSGFVPGHKVNCSKIRVTNYTRVRVRETQQQDFSDNRSQLVPKGGYVSHLFQDKKGWISFELTSLFCMVLGFQHYYSALAPISHLASPLSLSALCHELLKASFCSTSGEKVVIY